MPPSARHAPGCAEMAAPAVSALLRRWLKYSAAQRFEEATQRPRDAQEDKLLEIVRRNRDTVFGREHGFGAVRSIADFQAAAPSARYEDLEPYVGRMLDGERRVLTADDPLMFATTSGTTGR